MKVARIRILPQMKNSPKLLLVLLFLLCVSCTKKMVVHQYAHIDNDGWARNDTLSFEIPPVVANGDYALFLGMRYSNDMPYEAIWMEVETQFSHPRQSSLDTLCFQTADSTGMLCGKGINLKQQEVFLSSLQLKEGQHGTVKVRHIMARNLLPFVRDIGIKVVQEDTPQSLNR